MQSLPAPFTPFSLCICVAMFLLCTGRWECNVYGDEDRTETEPHLSIRYANYTLYGQPTTDNNRFVGFFVGGFFLSFFLSFFLLFLLLLFFLRSRSLSHSSRHLTQTYRHSRTRRLTHANLLHHPPTAITGTCDCVSGGRIFWCRTPYRRTFLMTCSAWGQTPSTPQTSRTLPLAP